MGEAEARVLGVCGVVVGAPPLDPGGVVMGAALGSGGRGRGSHTPESRSAQSPRCVRSAHGDSAAPPRFIFVPVKPYKYSSDHQIQSICPAPPAPGAGHGRQWEAGEGHTHTAGGEGRGTHAPGERRQMLSPDPRDRPVSPPHSDSPAPFWCKVNRVFPTLGPLDVFLWEQRGESRVEAVRGPPPPPRRPPGARASPVSATAAPELWSSPPVNV